MFSTSYGWQVPAAHQKAALGTLVKYRSIITFSKKHLQLPYSSFLEEAVYLWITLLFYLWSWLSLNNQMNTSVIWTPEFMKKPCKTGGVNGQRQSQQWKRRQNRRQVRDKEIKNEAKWRRGIREKCREHRRKKGTSEEESQQCILIYKYEK